MNGHFLFLPFDLVFSFATLIVSEDRLNPVPHVVKNLLSCCKNSVNQKTRNSLRRVPGFNRLGVLGCFVAYLKGGRSVNSKGSMVYPTVGTFRIKIEDRLSLRRMPMTKFRTAAFESICPSLYGS